MKLSACQVLDVSALLGALVINRSTNGEFYVTGVGVDLENHTFMIQIEDCNEKLPAILAWDALKDWEIQLSPKYSYPGR